MKPRQANALVWAAGLLPLALMLPGMRRADFVDPVSLLNLLGRLSGIAGLSFLLVAAILSCRVPGVDRPFGGLTKLWKTHHRLGAVAFLLLLAHPALLALSAAGGSLSAAAQLLAPPWVDYGTWLGWIALLAMMAFLAPSFAFFGEPEYQRWRGLHRLSAVAVIAAVAHAWWFSRTIPIYASTAIWLLLSVAALASVAWRLVFARRSGRLRYMVDEAIARANNVVELSLKPAARHLVYVAGQFIYLTPHDESLAAGRGEEHPYTLSSAPGEPALRVAIKDLGDATHAIQSIKPGSTVDVEGPYGDFFPRGEPCGPELWIAGGIGIAPFLGRLRDLAARGARLDAHLVYCVQDPARAHFIDELERLVARIPGMRLTPHYFYRYGPLDKPFLTAHCEDYVRRRAYICGPDPLIESVKSQLSAAGVRPDHIVTEEFTLL
jgi:predicted ferric reductase